MLSMPCYMPRPNQEQTNKKEKLELVSQAKPKQKKNVKKNSHEKKAAAPD